jgi:hypothetical protein
MRGGFLIDSPFEGGLGGMFIEAEIITNPEETIYLSY